MPSDPTTGQPVPEPQTGDVDISTDGEGDACTQVFISTLCTKFCQQLSTCLHFFFKKAKDTNKNNETCQPK